MRPFAYGLSLMFLAIPSVVRGQGADFTGANIGFGGGYGNPYSWHSSTAGEGYARGFAEIIRAQGEYNLATSAAAVNLSEARRREIENSKFWLQTYFELRDINREHRYAEYRRQRPSPQEYLRFSQAARPKPLTNQDVDPATGRLRWPFLLAFADFGPQRARIERAFAERAYHGVMSVDNYLNVMNATQIMLARLQSTVAAAPPQEYVTAKRFIERVAYDARSPSTALAARPRPIGGDASGAPLLR